MIEYEQRIFSSSLVMTQGWHIYSAWGLVCLKFIICF